MKKIYSNTILMALLVFGIKANAQCTSCTTNITGLDIAPHSVGFGQVLCISSTGTVTGQITVTLDGKLCNEGTINSPNLWIAGGTLNNYGEINTNNVLLTSSATFTNNGTAYIDTLVVSGTSASYVNNGIQISGVFATIDQGSTINTGTITAFDMTDSIGTFINYGELMITNGLAHIYNSSFINNGNMTITNDFSNAYSSTFTNNSYLNINRDYFNSLSSVFTSNCMATIGRDWYNSATIYGPASGSCGGFTVFGSSVNSGTLGSSSTHLDICDAGSPALGLDAPGGVIDATTTFCSCTNTCGVVSVGIKELAVQSNVIITTIYPNPSISYFTIKLNNKENEILTLEVRNMTGKIVLTKTISSTIGESETDINISNLSQGTYILNLTDSHQLQTKRLFSIAR